MRLEIKGLSELRERIERLRTEEVMTRALAEQAERMADAARAGLSEPAGSADHDRPWLRTGALRDSVSSDVDGLQAVVGSSDQAAVAQEIGTSRMQPRPFLAPIASSMGEDVARLIGARVAAALRGEGFSDAGSSDSAPGIVQVSTAGTDTGLALLGLGLATLGYFALRGEVTPRSRPFTHPPILHHSTSDEDPTEGATKPPVGSKPISQTPWSGDHQSIKQAIGAGATDDTRISPQGEVWSQHPDGSWTNYGPASNFTGSGRPRGQRGRDRR